MISLRHFYGASECLQVVGYPSLRCQRCDVVIGCHD